MPGARKDRRLNIRKHPEVRASYDQYVMKCNVDHAKDENGTERVVRLYGGSPVKTKWDPARLTALHVLDYMKKTKTNGVQCL